MDISLFPPTPKKKVPPSTDNLDLFAKPTRAPYVESPTSKAAAASIQPDTLKQRRAQVYALLVASGASGMTRQEIADALNRPVNWICSSVDSLIKVHKMIQETDRTRKNPSSGKYAAVLVACQFANGTLTEEPAA